MNTVRNEEGSSNPLIGAKEEKKTVANEDSPSKKDAVTRKVTPLQETPVKEREMNVKDDGKKPSKKDEMAPILLSNEDLKELYEKKKRLKKRKDVHHFKDAHEDYINSVAVSSNSKYLISGSSDRSIKVFDIETKQQIHHFKDAHDGLISSVAITPDCEYIISGSVDRSIKVFGLESKQEVYHFKDAHGSAITSMAVTSNNKYIVSGSDDMSIKIFELETKREVHQFKDAHESYISSIALSPNGKYIISGSHDNSVKIFDFDTKQQIHHFENAHNGPVYSVAVTPNNKHLVSASDDRSIKIFDIETKQQVHHFEDAGRVNSVVVTPDSRFIVSSTDSNSIILFDFNTKQQVHSFDSVYPWKSNEEDGRTFYSQMWGTSVAVTPDNRYIVSGSTDGSIKVLDLDIEPRTRLFETSHTNMISSIAVTSNNKYIISGSGDCSIQVFDFQTKELIHHFENAHEEEIRSLVVSPNDKYIIAGSKDGSIKVFDLNTKELVHHFKDAHESDVSTLVVTSDNKHMISGSMDCSIKMFDLNTKQLIHRFETMYGSISSLAVTSDFKYLIAGTYGSTIQIFDLKSKQQHYHFKDAHRKAVTSVLVTFDNKYLISASEDKSIKIFDLSTKQLVHHFKNAHEGEVTSLALTSDSKYLISGSLLGSVKVFDLGIKKQIHSFERIHGDDKDVTSLVLTSDNKYIVFGSNDTSIRVFEFPTKQEDRQIVPSEDPKKQAKLNPNDKTSMLIQNPRLLNDKLNFLYGDLKEFSISNSVDYFLFKKPVEYSISKAVKHPEIFVLPFNWTILHIVSVFAKDDFIERMPEYSEFKMPFLVDAFDRTPFHYLFAHKNVNSISANIMFRYTCDYLADCQMKDPHEFQTVIHSLSPLLSFIFEKIELKLRQRFLAIVYAKSSAPANNPIPNFGNILSESAVFCDSAVLTQETREQIWDDQGTTQVEFRSNHLNLDYNILSQDMKDLVDSLKTQTSQEIFKVPLITRLIDHLWGQAEGPLIIFFAFYSIFIIALSVYLTLKDRCLPYEIVLLAISASLTVNEFWQIYHLKKGYLENLWNWFDLAHLLLTIAFLITRIADNDNELARAWMSTIIVILGYLRWISLLKIFSPTRHLIQVVLTILRDMVSFIIVIALIIIGFSIIFLVFNRDAVYGDYLYEAYNVLYGPMDINEEAEWQFSQKLLMAVLAFFLNVVLLNLLISIMGDSYGQVLENRDKTDALTRLEMISEAVIYKRFFHPFYQTKRGCLVYCLPVELEEEENDQGAKLGNIIKNVKNLIQQNSELKQQNNEFKQQQNLMRNEMKSEISRLEERILSEFSKLKTSAHINK